MALELYLIRHAQSTNNKYYDDLVGGISKDISLTAEGRRQAELLGERLRYEGIAFDRIYSSSTRRTIDTCDIACRVAGYQANPIISDALVETDRGEWVGRKRSEVYGVFYDKNIDPWTFQVPGGESYKMTGERVHDYLKHELDDFCYDGKVAVFGHGHSFRTFMKMIIGTQWNLIYGLEIENTSITRLRYDDLGWHLVSINDHSHLIRGYGKTACEGDDAVEDNAYVKEEITSGAAHTLSQNSGR